MKKKEITDAKELKVASIDITYTKFDWDKEAPGGGWSIVHPDTSSLTQQQCITLLAYRDEIEEAVDEIGQANNVELWRERVSKSDRQHWDEFCPIMNFYCDIPDLDGNPSPNAMQNIVRLLPVMVVSVNGKPKLTASGEYPNMDLEFCRAYILLGFLPPFSMVNFTYVHQNIEPLLLSGCERSVELFEMKCTLKRSMLTLIKESYARYLATH